MSGEFNVKARSYLKREAGECRTRANKVLQDDMTHAKLKFAADILEAAAEELYDISDEHAEEDAAGKVAAKIEDGRIT